MYDSNAMLIVSTAAVEATVTGDGKDFGPSLKPEVYMTVVPEDDGTDHTFTLTIEESDDDSTYYVIATRVIDESHGVFFDTVVSSMRYRRAVLTIGGTDPDYGLVMVGRVSGGRYESY